MRKILLLLLIFFSTTAAHAQTFEPGYVVLSRGDTLRGQVENAFWSDPPTEVSFRASATAAITTYAARHLRSVGLQSGRLLRREAVPLDHSAQVELNSLPHGRYLEQRLDSVLADVLVEGPAMLLEVKLNEVKHFLIRRETQPYLELAERRYIVAHNGVNKIMDGNDYHSQLLLYFGDCPAAVAAAEKAPFTATSMIQVVQAYNQQCSSAQQAGREWPLPEKARGRIAVQIGPVLGVRYDAMRLHLQSDGGATPATLDGINVYGRPHGQGGFYFDVVMPGRRLALHTSLLYSRYGRTARVETSTPTMQADLDVRGSITTLYVGLRGLRSVRAGSAYRFVYGTGFQLHYYHDEAQSVSYYRNGVAMGSGYLSGGFIPTLLPYVEGGIRHDRLTLTLTVRRYKKGAVYENFNYYTGRTWSTALALAYRLNGNTDK